MRGNSALNWKSYNSPSETFDILSACPNVVTAGSTGDLFDLTFRDAKYNRFKVVYDLPDREPVVEATVVRVRNGMSVNYPEPYMRRRDPDCLLVGDDLPTNKPTYQERFGQPFDSVRQKAIDWLKTQELAIFGFIAGQPGMGIDVLAVVPANAGFFAFGLAMLQGILSYEQIEEGFDPKAVIYAVPPFRHTHFDGKQIVVHNRKPDLYEMFAFNLYPGPSAKKGVYGMLIDLGEREEWVTTHCSAVQVVTPYDNLITFMHEGASGGGKSEMLEQAHREPDGRLLLGENLVTGERRHLEIPRSCELHPAIDDMALFHPAIQNGNGRPRITDAEDAWFVRVNHINYYGADMYLERLTAQPNTPLLFLNIDAEPGSRALIWEHTEDAPGKPCPNPRVIIPRSTIPNVVDGAVSIDIRSFGLRMPPCTREQPSYGIVGMFHLLPPALAWLWRLVSPRGHNSPSIVDSGGMMKSEGVGSYWPFAVGRRVPQANLLLKQFVTYKDTRHILCPNQHIGAWRVGFMAQWIAREYLSRRGVAKFKPDQLRPARCPLLGYTAHQLHVEGRSVARWFLQVDTQPEVGEDGYDAGADILYEFFRRCLPDFLDPDLDPLGRQIIECCLDGGSLVDYEAMIPVEYFG
ncbi:MAG: DUF4914 family protein [Anaerolineae bacterium]|nr:DUF4914 family protein [Anaerolineae bacterium]